MWPLSIGGVNNLWLGALFDEFDRPVIRIKIAV